MAHRRKYRDLPPQDVANAALQDLISKIPTMIQDYAKAMNNFAKDEEAQRRYVRGVSNWVTVMRNPDIREQIASAISQARKAYYKRMMPYVEVASGTATIPATVPG